MKTTIKLVTNEVPVWATVQGEGVLTGVPSVFVRVHGCDFTCTWCDTKGSWAPGSVFQERPLEEVEVEVKKLRPTHVVITGGNPFLQADACTLLANRLCYAGVHVTVETQGSIFDAELSTAADLLSISPKLHSPMLGADLYRFLSFQRDRGRKRETQIKVVVEDLGHVEEAYELFSNVREFWDGCGGLPYFILQPEYSKGREFLRVVSEHLTYLQQEKAGAKNRPVVRVMGQAHKLLYSLR